MTRGPVNRKNLDIETNYGYLNIYLDKLHKAITENNKEEITKNKAAVKEIKHKLVKLGYFEGRS